MAKEDRNRLIDTILVTFTFLLIAWTVFGLEELLGYNLKTHGLRPREWRGLVGIGSMHFLHGDLKHIASNTLSFVILNGFLFFFYRKIAWKVFWQIAILGGAFLWLWGRESNHIGASLLIYGQAAFLFFSGIFRQDERMLRVALVVAFYFGSIIWWIFPIDPSISWEGHLSGAVVGIIGAYLYRGSGPQRKKYMWEIEEEMEELREKEMEEGPHSTTSNSVIHYEFKPAEREEDSTSDNKT